jgi:hypothetical protein
LVDLGGNWLISVERGGSWLTCLWKLDLVFWGGSFPLVEGMNLFFLKFNSGLKIIRGVIKFNLDIEIIGVLAIKSLKDFIFYEF